MQADAVAWLHLQAGDDVQFIGISSESSYDDIVETAAKVRIDGFPQIIDTDGAALAHFGLLSHPSLMLIDAEGNKALSTGMIDPMSTLEAVKALPTNATST